LEKVFGVGALLLLSVLGLTYGTYFVDHTTFKALASPVLLVSGVFLAAIIALVIIVRLDLLDRFGLNSKFGTRVQELVRQFSILSSRGSAVLTVLLLSLLIQIGVVGWYFAASRAVGLDLSIIAFMVTIPLVELLLMLPISIGGIGVREGGFVVLLTPFGLTMEDAVSFSLLSLMMLTIIRVSFGVAFLFELDPATPVTKTEAIRDR
jgi:hypothetical protein